jgi:hypothetical protein
VPQDSRAQTNAQLLLQMWEGGRSPEDLRRIRDAYILAVRLYPGMFTGSGKTTLAHEDGTGSLAYRHGAQIHVVAACVLHGAYIDGDWVRYRTGVTEEDRREVRRAIGEPAQLFVHGVSGLPWITAASTSCLSVDEFRL